MVLDNLKNIEQYCTLHPLFKDAFDYIKTTNFIEAPVGKVELKGMDLFVIVSDSELRSKSEAKIEVHNQYIDIQLPISDTEVFGWVARSELKEEVEPFDEAKDIQFFDDDYTTQISLEPGNFVVFFPEDGHAPCIGEGIVRKVVIKIKK